MVVLEVIECNVEAKERHVLLRSNLAKEVIHALLTNADIVRACQWVTG
jgi:hypothetical protein